MQETGHVSESGNGRTLLEARDELIERLAPDQADDQVEPSRIYVARRMDIPAAPVEAKTQAPRRMRWVKLPSSAELGYTGWMIYMWTSFPGELLNRLGDADGDEKKDLINQIFLQHNGWRDYDGNLYPQPTDDVEDGTPDFWDAIPQEVANALIQLMNVEQKQLSFLVRERPGTSRRS